MLSCERERDRGRPPQEAGERASTTRLICAKGEHAHPPPHQANTFSLLATPTARRVCLSSSGFMHGQPAHGQPVARSLLHP